MNRLWLSLQLALVAGLLGILAACGGTRPVRYYALEVESGPAATPAVQFPVTLLVSRVTASHLYRDDRLVYGFGSLELETYEYQRWAESPIDMVQEDLVAALRASGEYRSVSGVATDLRGEYVVRSHLYALNEIDKPAIAGRFSYQIDLYDPHAEAIVWTQTYTHDEPVNGKKVSDVVEALDRNVNTGIQQLTAGIGQYFAAHPPAPPAKP